MMIGYSDSTRQNFSDAPWELNRITRLKYHNLLGFEHS